MKNPERRAALDKARKLALSWAEKAEDQWPLSPASADEYAAMSNMWSLVAEAMKVGDERADNV